MGIEGLLWRSEQKWGLRVRVSELKLTPSIPAGTTCHTSLGGTTERWREMSEREKEKKRRGCRWAEREGRGGNNELQLNLDLTIRRLATPLIAEQRSAIANPYECREVRVQWKSTASQAFPHHSYKHTHTRIRTHTHIDSLTTSQ